VTTYMLIHLLLYFQRIVCSQRLTLTENMLKVDFCVTMHLEQSNGQWTCGKMFPEDVHVLIPRTHDYVSVHR
jgi:hypothetical protein